MAVAASPQVSFDVNVEARSCPQGGASQSFTIKPVGFKDRLEVVVDYSCDCGCTRAAQTNSSVCSSSGERTTPRRRSRSPAHARRVFVLLTESNPFSGSRHLHLRKVPLRTGPPGLPLRVSGGRVGQPPPGRLQGGGGQADVQRARGVQLQPVPVLRVGVRQGLRQLLRVRRLLVRPPQGGPLRR